MSSYNPYSSYGGNPYAPTEDAQAQQPHSGYGGATSSPYAGAQDRDYGQQQQSPYRAAGGHGQTVAGTPYGQSAGMGSAYGQGGQISSPYGRGAESTAPGTSDHTTPQQQQQQQQPYGAAASPTLLSHSDFLSRVEAAKASIRTLSTQVSSIATLHQRTLSSTDSSSNSTALESLLTDTQVLNTSIKDQIRFLEEDSVRSRSAEGSMKATQVGSLKASFRKQLEAFRQEEAEYERRYREQIARQYRIVNPEASEDEVREATRADWGNEGVFQTALKTNRTATASTVLGAVRARHADIQRIERTLLELNKLFEELAAAVIVQEPLVERTEQHTEQVKRDTEAGNVHLGKGVDSARRARKLKWWCLALVVLICAVIAIALGVYFGVTKKAATAGQ